MDRLAGWLNEEDVEPALRLLTFYERFELINSGEAAEWRKRIVGWARFRGLGPDSRPSA
jgi:hypothetical protein